MSPSRDLVAKGAGRQKNAKARTQRDEEMASRGRKKGKEPVSDNVRLTDRAQRQSAEYACTTHCEILTRPFFLVGIHQTSPDGPGSLVAKMVERQTVIIGIARSARVRSKRRSKSLVDNVLTIVPDPLPLNAMHTPTTGRRSAKETTNLTTLMHFCPSNRMVLPRGRIQDGNADVRGVLLRLLLRTTSKKMSSTTRWIC